MNDERSLLFLADAHARASGLRITSISNYACGSGAALARIRSGRSMTARRIRRAIQWFSDHWPAGADWPADIPRPAPTAAEEQRPITQTAARVSDPVATARAAWDRMVDAGSPEARRAAAAEAFAAGARLNAAGRIASPAALCAALGCDRKVYDNTVARYGPGRGPRFRNPPRPGSQTARMLAALKQAGDVRFNPLPQEAA